MGSVEQEPTKGAPGHPDDWDARAEGCEGAPEAAPADVPDNDNPATHCDGGGTKREEETAGVPGARHQQGKPEPAAVEESVRSRAEPPLSSSAARTPTVTPSARKLWKTAGTKVRTQVALSMQLMVMRGRTGGKLLDADTGSATDRLALEETYQRFKMHRDECERLGNYAEATAINSRMEAIRQQEDQKRREEMEKSHLADNIKVEMVQLEEVKKLTAEWERRMQEYEAAVARSQAAMAARHAQEHEALRQRIYKPLEKPKWSTHLLNLQAMHTNSAAAQDYDRAIEVQKQAGILQAQEKVVMEADAAARHADMAEKMEERHDRERETFEDRFDFGRRKREHARAQDFQNLEYRFRNVKAEMARLQERESMQLDLAIDSSIGLGKTKTRMAAPPAASTANDGSEYSEETTRPVSPMRAAQHAYDWNVRFGNKAGNASTITEKLNLTAAKGGDVLGRRVRRGRAALASSSPTFPQPHTGGAMPHYLLPASAPGSQPFRPSSRIEATDPKAAATFRAMSSSSAAAIEIYSRPVTAPARPGSATARRRAGTAEDQSFRPGTAAANLESACVTGRPGRTFGNSASGLPPGRESPYLLLETDLAGVETPRTFSPPRTPLGNSLATAGLSSHRPPGSTARPHSPWSESPATSMELPSLPYDRRLGATEDAAGGSSSYVPSSRTHNKASLEGLGSRPPGVGAEATKSRRSGRHLEKPVFQGSRPVSRAGRRRMVAP